MHFEHFAINLTHPTSTLSAHHVTQWLKIYSDFVGTLIHKCKNNSNYKSRSSVLVLELEMSVLRIVRIVNLFFHRTSSQQIPSHLISTHSTSLMLGFIRLEVS